MRIIERTNYINKSVLFVVQDEDYRGAFAMGAQQSVIGNPRRNVPFVDVRSFTTLQEAKDFMYQYANNLQPGERIVS